MKKTSKVLRGAMGVSATLLAILLSGTSVAYARAGFINNALGVSNYQKVEVDGDNKIEDTTYFKSKYKTLAELVSAKEALAEQISAEGSVLLKNDNSALPLDRTKETVTLWGLNSHTPTFGGMIGSSATAGGVGQKMYGMEEALQEKGFKLNETMKALYASDAMNMYLRRGFGQTGHGLSPAFGMIYENAKSTPSGEAAPSVYTNEILASADNTTAVVVISRDVSEAADYQPGMTCSTPGDAFTSGPLALSNYEREMIQLAKAHSKKVVVVINADNQMEIEELKNDNEIDAILWAGVPGSLGFLGVADVLSGATNPSAGLPDTYAVSSESSPAMQNFGVYLYSNNSKTGAAQGNIAQLTTTNKADWYVVESEGIYNGYKYYETRYADLVAGKANAGSAKGASNGAAAWKYEDEVSYPFGYGLSYTTFTQTLKSVSVDIGGVGTAVVEVKNTGNKAGKTSIQLYVQAPYTENGLEKSAVQLVDFAKTDLLQEGETKEYTIEFDPTYIASYDEDAVKANGKKGAWSIEKGTYYFAVGNGSHEALNNILSAQGVAESKLVKTAAGEAISVGAVKTWNNGKTDIETYSKNVENAMQDCDLNHFIKDYVEYTTRADWTKGWKSYTNLTPTADMMVGLTNSTFKIESNNEETVTWGAKNGLVAADLITYDANGKYTGVVDFDDLMWDKLIDQVTLEEAANFIEKAGEKTLEALPSIELAITYWFDGPTGVAKDQNASYSVKWTDADKDEPTYVGADDACADYSMNTLPTAPVVAATFNKTLVEEMGAILGEDSLWSNSNSLAGPGSNLHRTPFCARNHEYYSEDSQLSNLMGASVCKGSLYTGIMMMPKHFAFNHQESNRSGVSTFFNEQAGRENELRCFQIMLSQNLAKGVMSGFNRAGVQFSGGYTGTQVQILRNEWGYTGWVVTDMINGADYMNWRDVVLGGGGGCLTGSAYNNSEIGSMQSAENLALIKKDMKFQKQMKEIVKIFVQNIVASNAMNAISTNTRMVYVNTAWQNAIIAADCVVGVATLGIAGGYVWSLLKGKKEENV